MYLDTNPDLSGPQEIDPRTLGLFKIAYSINEVLSLLPIGRTALYDSINRGELTIRKYGKRTVILAVDLARFINRLGNPKVAVKVPAKGTAPSTPTAAEGGAP